MDFKKKTFSSENYKKWKAPEPSLEAVVLSTQVHNSSSKHSWKQTDFLKREMRKIKALRVYFVSFIEVKAWKE